MDRFLIADYQQLGSNDGGAVDADDADDVTL